MTGLLLFLGAGASNAVGIPTMTKMVETLESQIGQKDERELFVRIRDAIRSQDKPLDIEALLSVVDAISKGRSARDLGHVVSYLVKEVHGGNPDVPVAARPGEGKVAARLMTTLRMRIRELCSPSGVRSGDPAVFGPFWDLLEKLAKVQGFAKAEMRGASTVVSCPIYTTNYDLAVESFFEGHHHLHDPFRDDDNTGVGILPTSGGFRGGTLPQFLKLHGSLNWHWLDDGRIVKLRSPRTHVEGHKVGEEVMLYPVQQKDIAAYPWFELYASFRDELRGADTWIFVGYQFQDEAIRGMVKEVLADRVHNGKSVRMLIISPHAMEVAERVADKDPAILSAIKLVVGRFGDSATHDEVVRLLSPSELEFADK